MLRTISAFLGRFSVVFALVTLIFGPASSRQAHCQTIVHYSLGGGTLNFDYVGAADEYCTNQETHARTEYPVYTWDNFSYTYDGVTYPLQINEVEWWRPIEFCVDAPPTYTTQYIIPETELCNVTLLPAAGALGATESCETAQNGYINPKYVVVDVMYAPPGSKSYVSYSSSTAVSDTQEVINSSTTSQTVTASTGFSGSLEGFLGGSETDNSSDTLTQEVQNTNSFTLTDTDTSVLTVYGPGGAGSDCGTLATEDTDYIGVDHDCDVIRVWLNPVALFSIYGDTVIWDGYGSSALDPVAPINIDNVRVGCLNGDIPDPSTNPYCSSFYADAARTWAAGENWASGEGPGLTPADLANILAADPWGNCTPTSPVGSSACPTYAVPGFSLLPPQFNLSDQTDVPYQQSSPLTEYQVTTESSDMEGETSTTTKSQTYGYEDAFTGTTFLGVFSTTVGYSQTFTTSNEVENQTTTANTSIGTAYITGPACSGDPCSPAYPPASPYYGQATSFDIFTDQFYGTFAFVPSDYQ